MNFIFKRTIPLILFGIIIVQPDPGLHAQTVTDFDGNIYQTVTIGTQMWMKENLRTTRFSNGDTLPNITDSVPWSVMYDPARCYYNNDSTSFATVFGCLYNWYAAYDSRNICPTGWHVPTDSEWHTLVHTIDSTAQSVLGVESYTAGGALKDTSPLWADPNTGATNSSGFSALPCGYRTYQYQEIHANGYWWTSTNVPGIYPFYRRMGFASTYINRSGYEYQYGLSIRCLRDLGVGIGKTKIGNNQIRIYPNPTTSGYVYIDIQNQEQQGPLELRCYNSVGKRVYSRTLFHENNPVRIDVADWPGGIYFIELTGDGVPVRQAKFVVRK